MAYADWASNGYAFISIAFALVGNMTYAEHMEQQTWLYLTIQ